MRIVYHHRTQGRGVEAVHIRGIVNALRARGHEVDVLSPPGCDPFQEQQRAAAAQGAPARHPIWRRISAHAPELLFEMLEMAYNGLAAARLIGTPRPDLIYERYFVFSLAAAAVARLRGCRIIYEINDSSFLKQRVRKLLLVRLARAIERRVLKRADLVIAVSRNMATTLEQVVGIDRARILVLPNAIEEDAVVPRASMRHAVGQEIVIGFVGLFVPWHGLNLLLDAVGDLTAAGTPVRLLLVGDGPVRGELEQRAVALGIADRLTITGTVPHHEVKNWLQKIDVAVLADSNEYGSPMKIFEYMAAARPIVAPDYGPVVEVLRDGDNGLVFPRRNGEGLRAALKRLADDPALRERLGESARETVLREHTWIRNAERLEQAVGIAPGAAAHPSRV